MMEVSYSDFEKSLFASNYYLKEFLGKGAFGGVFLADEVIDRNTIRQVAVKIIRESEDSARQQLINRELEIACNLNHPNILRCFCPVKDSLAYTDNQTNETRINSYKGLVMEVALVSLESYLKTNKVSEKEVRDIVIQITEGLSYLHSRTPPVIHRDLKPANILMVDGSWKLADFGIARPLDSSSSIVHTQVSGTPLYLSPETLKDEVVSTAGDMWALGIIIIEMLRGQYPYSLSGNSIQDLYKRIIHQKPKIPPLPAPFDRIVKNCLVKDRKQRWTVKQVLDVLQEKVHSSFVTTVIPNEDDTTIIPTDSGRQNFSSGKPTKPVDGESKNHNNSSKTVIPSYFPLWQKGAVISAVLIMGTIGGLFVLPKLLNLFATENGQNSATTQAATSAEFYCDETNLLTKVNSPSYDNPKDVIIWEPDNDRFGDEWTPLKRCQEVSRRFQDIYERHALKYVQTDLAQWKDRDIAIICSVKSEKTRCQEQDLLFTLETKDDPNEILADLIALKEDPINNEPLRRGEDSPKTFSEGKRDIYDLEKALDLPEPPKETPKPLW